ncbi:hypothetical protein PHMEG_0009244 [Phytophthora megakarya]|uniref:Uncharacterized protein n=1 Tax=Phytophthora megakarya TaxID=4795 RepID=A0A225WIR0_9STRA|nr:hypothetical protein PHMEG_0009244 [Phytophthora megakarya]
MSNEIASSNRRKESEVQRGEAPSRISRPSVSASGSRGTFSCRRWRLLSGKPSKDDDTLLSTRKSSFIAGMVQRPTIAAVDSNDWATAATPFAAFLPRDTMTPITSRKSVAAAVLTSAVPSENAKKFEREMVICERKHVKAMGRMTTKVYRSKSAKGDRSELSKVHKNREKDVMKSQIYLPVLRHEQTGGVLDVSSRGSKVAVHTSPRHKKAPQDMTVTELPECMAGMKLLSSQLDELRAGLALSSRDHEIYESTMELWCPPQLQRSTKKTCSQTDSSSSSIETLLLRVLERPEPCLDGYEADQEESITESCGDSSKPLGSTCAHSSKSDLLYLLTTLDSSPQDEF